MTCYNPLPHELAQCCLFWKSFPSLPADNKETHPEAATEYVVSIARFIVTPLALIQKHLCDVPSYPAHFQRMRLTRNMVVYMRHAGLPSNLHACFCWFILSKHTAHSINSLMFVFIRQQQAISRAMIIVWLRDVLKKSTWTVKHQLSKTLGVSINLNLLLSWQFKILIQLSCCSWTVNC